MAEKNNNRQQVDITPKEGEVKKPFLRNRTFGILVSVIVLLALSCLALAIYLLFFYQNIDIDALTKDFCACTESPEVQKSAMVYSRDNFKYKEGLNDFAKRFTESIENYSINDSEKEAHLKKFCNQVLKECPDNLKILFETVPAISQ